MNRRTILIILLMLNLVVLVGQIWPANAPPFAREVNLVFLIASLLFFGAALRKGR